ncbi:hypothetical protein J7444_19660 [Labrenzia sp. R4_1]|uniref:hypothetical protein n=1 Tax=Labrenzia sp. R4_1 TaxID=2821106 RepID=UPI001ADCE6F0|nr:hypothetical protein [Labrenzia sp. R4_1]MBO9426961.1 hypothetical protein [Labrenzia sp. R4_1]
MTTTLEDLKAAKDKQRYCEDRIDRYDGNNPNKYQAYLKAARREVSLLEEALKLSGALEQSETEKLWAQLDEAFPKARSKQVVTFEGQAYRRIFWPEERSRSGKTVTRWGRGWASGET